MANKFMPHDHEESGSAGFLVRDLVRFFIVDIILLAIQKLLLGLGFFSRPDTYVLAILTCKIILLLYLVWLIRDRRDAWRETGADNPGRWWAWPASLILYAAAYPLLLWADRFSHIVMDKLHAVLGWVYTPAPQDVIMLIFDNALDSPTRLALVFFTVLAGPFMEELAFRGMGMDAFRREYGPGPAIFWTSVLFGLYHFSLPLLIPLSLLGVLFATVRVYSRSLWCPFFLHFFHNSLALGITAYELGLLDFWKNQR